MADSVGKPRQNVKHHILVSGKDVTDISTVENVFQSRQHANPDCRAPVARDELASVEKYKPSCNREEWQEELARNREKERDEK